MERDLLESAKLPYGRYYLKREEDGKAASGNTLMSVDSTGILEHRPNGEIHVGFHVKCGSLSSRDFWETTTVQSIEEVTDTTIKFKTRNSTYIAGLIQ